MPHQQEQSFGIVPLEEVQGKWRVFLVQHRTALHWGFPKGHANDGETDKDAAIRELLEETGLKVGRFLTQSPIVESYQCEKHEQTVDKTVSYYPAIVQGIAVLQYEEIAMGKWFSLEEASSQITFEESRRVLKEVVEILNGTKS